MAQALAAPSVLFPELGALSHDVLKRPHGAWARAPSMLVLTPFRTGLMGTLITRNLSYGVPSVLLAVGGAVGVIAALRSPVAPAISAASLPLTLGIRSWSYAPLLRIGLVSLAGLSLGWRRFAPSPPDAGLAGDLADDATEQPPRDWSWLPFLVVFLVLAAIAAQASGLRLVLFPPLAVIAFEMFAHARVCPWAGRPLALAAACTIAAAAGAVLTGILGDGPLAALASIAAGSAVLRLLDLHVPPALAAALLPWVTGETGYSVPLAVGPGTLLLTACFAAWRATGRVSANAPWGRKPRRSWRVCACGQSVLVSRRWGNAAGLMASPRRIACTTAPRKPSYGMRT
ncbi:MAG: HPP family protein [Proteobacteria bacterium]|nr:HPP family protein [Pseudomonadota bacterium]